jgi:predicted ester cyclase
MSLEKNKDLIRGGFEAFNIGKPYSGDKFFAVDGIDHMAPPGSPPGFAFMKQLNNMVLAAFPDVHVTVEDLIAEGDKVVCRITVSGTHKGEFMGMPPTGKRFTIQEIRIYRITGGKVVEHWGVVDRMGMMQQLSDKPPS